MEIRNEEEKLGFFIADHIGVGLFRNNLSTGRIELFNKAFVKMFGFGNKNKTKGIVFGKLFRTARKSEEFLNKVRRKKHVNFYEVQLKKSTGGYFWAAITASLIKFKNVFYIEGMIEDISKHKQYEDKLEFERQLFQQLLDTIPDAIYFKDRCNRIIRVNKFYAQGFKMSQEKIIGKTDFDFFPRQQAQLMFRDDNYVLRTGKPIVGKLEKTLLPNGTWNRVVTTKIPMYDRKGKIIGTMGITRDITNISRIEEEKLEMVTNAVMALSRALEVKDPYTFGHANRVGIIAERIARELNWSDDEILGIKISAQLHDIGKIAVPSEILTKPGFLSELEYKVVQEHVQKCYDIVKDIKYPFPLAETIYQHHERLDGSGYPRRLTDKKIIPQARLLAICDVLEAMTFHRPYRQALGIVNALEELKQGADKKYDGKLVKIVIKLIKKDNGNIFWLNSSN